MGFEDGSGISKRLQTEANNLHLASLQTDNHTNTSSLNFYPRDAMLARVLQGGPKNGTTDSWP